MMLFVQRVWPWSAASPRRSLSCPFFPSSTEGAVHTRQLPLERACGYSLVCKGVHGVRASAGEEVKERGEQTDRAVDCGLIWGAGHRLLPADSVHSAQAPWVPPLVLLL